MTLKDQLLEQHRVDAIKEALMGFIWDEIVNPKGEFHYDDAWDCPDSSSRRSSAGRTQSSAGPSRRS